MRRHEQYLRDNREWLLKDAPRKANLRVYEAVYHFNLFRYLVTFLGQRGHVYPEFPTGNGKIDLIIEYGGQTYGLEVKSYSDQIAYREALRQPSMVNSWDCLRFFSSYLWKRLMRRIAKNMKLTIWMMRLK